MFHLLVACQGWPDSGGSISNARIYIKPTDERGQKYFYTDGKPDIAKINQIPALLVTETNGDGPQYARVARIINVKQSLSETLIEYIVDGNFPSIYNKDLKEGYSAQLGLGRFGLTHTHWTICETDLCKILLSNQQKNAIAPKVFSINAIKNQDPKLVSVMMPFRADFNSVYSSLQSAASAIGLDCVRADDIWENHTIIQDVVDLISRARVVICDCSGKNPNVFYEAGIANVLGKEVILITQLHDDVPFDLRHLRYIHYLPNGEGLNNLSKAVESKLRSIISSN